ncbi:DNA transfer protein [Escherichia coli]|nr:DNA transfer protein [Escherichia coli]
MATWQLGGLPSMAPQNDNAPRSSVPQPVQYQQQPNVGLMALQGLRGVAEINQQAQISQQLKEYQARLGSAVANNDRVGVQKLMAQYPQFMADSQKQMGFIDAEQNRQTADAAMNLRLASQTGDPLTMQKAIQQANPVLQRFGLPAEEVYQSWQNDPQEFNRITDLIHLHADPNSYFSVQEKQQGQSIAQQNADTRPQRYVERTGRTTEALKTLDSGLPKIVGVIMNGVQQSGAIAGGFGGGVIGSISGLVAGGALRNAVAKIGATRSGRYAIEKAVQEATKAVRAGASPAAIAAAEKRFSANKIAMKAIRDAVGAEEFVKLTRAGIVATLSGMKDVSEWE